MTRAPPDPVKLFAAILWSDAGALGASILRLEEVWGPKDFVGPDRAFDITDYYEREMGPGLLRRLVAFERLVAPDALPERKLDASAIEEELRGPRGRRVNIDVGYLDLHKVVLASGKAGPQKIYLGSGVWADMACWYSKGAFHPFAWSFPDFRRGRYDRELLELRAAYKAQLRAGGFLASGGGEDRVDPDR